MQTITRIIFKWINFFLKTPKNHSFYLLSQLCNYKMQFNDSKKIECHTTILHTSIYISKQITNKKCETKIQSKKQNNNKHVRNKQQQTNLQTYIQIN
jgi:hypothetical protein